MGMKRPKTYSIGAMARLCGISPRQLRYYDQIGLIKPKYRNPETGYRYYTEDQIELLFFLNELRNIGISNESIPRLFINRDVEQLVQELQLNLAMVEQEIQASLNRYHSIVNALVMNTRTLAYLTGQEAIDSSRYQHFWISVNWVPESRVLYNEYTDEEHAGVLQDYIGHVVELSRQAEAMGLKLGDTKLSIREHCDLTALSEGVPGAARTYQIAREILNKNVEDQPGHIKRFGGYNALCTVSTGDPGSLTDAYKVLREWAVDHSIALSDTVIEEYMADTFTSTDRTRYVTRIIIPVQER